MNDIHFLMCESDGKIDVERMKQGETVLGKDYFQELLEIVRSIRASERRIWQKITDVFAEISFDYDKNSNIKKNFYSMVQNKFDFAIIFKTAAEIVYSSADKGKDNRGLTIWKHSQSRRILRADAVVARNYLRKEEIKSLERNVSTYLDYIERLLEKERLLGVNDFVLSIDEFSMFNQYKISTGKGSISQKQAQKKAVSEFIELKKYKTIKSNFDQVIKKLKVVKE